LDLLQRVKARPATYNEDMNTVHLTDAELEMARHAVRAYRLAFGHDEADTLAEINRVIAKLGAAEAEPELEEPRTLA
jgi:hypothetical protein